MPRILHISDVHFGPHHDHELSGAVVELVERDQPDAVILSGDLTQRAKPAQFREAREFVDRLAAPTLAVPGNHDVPLYRFWERFLVPYGAYRTHFDREIEPVLEVEGLYAVGVNSAHGWTLTDGRIRMRRLVRLAEQLAKAPRGAVKVVVIHHPLVPPPLLEWPRAIDNARETAEVLVDAEVDLVLAGHIHQTFLTSLGAYFGDTLPGVRVVHTGTTTSRRGRWHEKGRNTLNRISIGAAEIDVGVQLWEPTARRFRELSRHRYPRRPAEVLAAAKRCAKSGESTLPAEVRDA